MSAPVGLPQFSSIHIAGFKSNLEALLKNNLEQVKSLLQQNHVYTWDNLMYPLEDLDDNLDHFWSPLSHLQSVMDSKPLRECYEACLPLLSAYDAAISHNQKLYEAIKSIDQKKLNSTQQKIIEDSLRSFELYGVALTPKKKKRFERIQERLADLSNQ